MAFFQHGGYVRIVVLLLILNDDAGRPLEGKGVDGDILWLQGNGLPQAVLKTLHRISGQPGNQIHVDVLVPGAAGIGIAIQNILCRMLAADVGQHRVREGLVQMLFRGQNMLGYRPYADDAVEYFVQKSVANGIDVIRIFDALNDPRNLQTAIKAANKEGAHVQGCISYTLSPVHNNEYYVKYAKTLEEMGANSICIKDMAGLLTPYTCYDLVKELKNTLSIPVDIHSHYTAGLASMSLLKGIEAGADIVDTAMSPLSGGTSHMATESLVAALQGTDYDTGLDLKQLNVVRAYFAKLREKYIANGQISPKSLGVDANTLLYQVPGGMFSNMLKQLKDAGKEDKLDEVLAEIPRVREDAGYPPLVTPTSQIVGTQAVFNVILGERYKMVTKEFKGLVHGDYGKTPAPIKPEFTKKILGDEQPITCRFADTLAPEMDKLKAEAAKWATQEEDVLTYAMFPQVAPKFFEKRNAKKQGVDADHADYANKSHIV